MILNLKFVKNKLRILTFVFLIIRNQLFLRIEFIIKIKVHFLFKLKNLNPE